MADRKDDFVEIRLKIDPAIADGHYVNWSLVSHNPAEFIIDFCKIMSGVIEHKVKTRVVMNPLAFKSLVIALKINLGKYEEVHGEIKGVEAFSKQIIDAPVIKDREFPN